MLPEDLVSLTFRCYNQLMLTKLAKKGLRGIKEIGETKVIKESRVKTVHRASKDFQVSMEHRSIRCAGD